MRVRECEIKDCVLYEYRLGKNPRRSGVGSSKNLHSRVSSENAEGYVSVV